jgi:hypothetical protein
MSYVYEKNCDQVCDTCHYRANHGFYSPGRGKKLYFECTGCAQRSQPLQKLEQAIAYQVFITSNTQIFLRPEIAEERVIDPIRESAFRDQVVSEMVQE